MKKLTFFLIIIISFLFLNKIILSKIIIYNLEKKISRDITIENFTILHTKSEIILKNLKIKDKKNISQNYIFLADKIKINYELNSIFSKKITFTNIEIINSLLNLEFEISKNIDKKIKDNIGISENIKNKKKIYPKKIIDINFFVNNLKIENFKVNIKRSDNIKSYNVVLSNMYFKKFGNVLGKQHYKDVYKLILTDLVLRIPDKELIKVIKNNYKLSDL